MAHWTSGEPRKDSVPLGRVLATPGALAALRGAGIPLESLLARHARADWGEVCAEDWEANDRAVAGGGRLFSAYALGDGRKLWVITEWDRSATTALLPDEY